MVLDFISRMEYDNTWISVTDLTNKFRNYIGQHDDDDKWLNTKWFGQALKRLNLLSDKRRLGRGVDVLLNKTKANEKMLIFK